MITVHPIPPCFDDASEILILGSFPSVKSREQGFFYGHPKNRFWEVLRRITEDTSVVLPLSIPEKEAFLHTHHIAVWDVIASCEIEGSSDASIKNVLPNDIRAILEKTKIRKIFCNGGKAFELYEKNIYPLTGLKAVKLPSTSPANAALSAEKLSEIWKSLIYPDIFCPPYPAATVVCLSGSREEAENVWLKLTEDPALNGKLPVLISVPVRDWNRELSPWKAEKVFKSGEDFGGEADIFLASLLEYVKASEEKLIGEGKCIFSPDHILAGYSLAGLFSLYAAFKTDYFSRFVSCSGSIWFDGFLTYAGQTAFAAAPDYIYLSLGDREKITKNPRMKTVEDCTEAFRNLVSERNVPVDFILNPGNHFNDPEGRLSSGIRSAVLVS